MIVLLVGPSAIGKTTLGQACASRVPEYEFVDLDDAIANLNNTPTAYQTAKRFGLDKFLNDCREVVASYESKGVSSDSTLIIALGEWALRMDDLETWLSKYRTISLMAPAEEVFQRRNQNMDIAFKDYCRFNYSDERRKIYANCDLALDIGNLPREEAVEKLMQAIESLRNQRRSAR